MRHGDHVGLQHRLRERSRCERVVRAQRRLHRGEQRLRFVGGIALDLQPEAEACSPGRTAAPRSRADRRSPSARASRLFHTGLAADSAAPSCPATVIAIVGPAGSCSTCACALAMPVNAQREVFVVEQRHDAAERARAERHRPSRLVGRFGVGAALRRDRVADALQSERPRRQLRQFVGADVALAARAPGDSCARTLFTPLGRRAPRTPSPNTTQVLPCSSVLSV